MPAPANQKRLGNLTRKFFHAITLVCLTAAPLFAERLPIKTYTVADGLPGSLVETAYRDRNNNLWFGTHKGVARFVPEPKRERQPPTILITGLRVEGHPQSISILGETSISNLELDSDQRQVSVDFLGLGAPLGEKLKYEYRFGNSEWTQTNERTVNFANLAAGAYQFQVRAVTADRLSSPTPAALTFRIATPLWQRPWFIVGVVAVAIFLIHIFYRYRLSRLLEMERMRTRIATDLHDEIGSNLSLIAMVSEVAGRKVKPDDSQVAGWLSLIANTSRETVDSMSDIVWAVNPHRDRIGDLTQRMRQVADDAFTARDIAFRFSAPAAEDKMRVDAESRRQIFMIFKEGVNNITRHAHCTKAEIELTIEDHWLHLRLSDNGRGFDVADASSGNGLASMHRRAKDLGGELEINSLPGGGTTVILKAPRDGHA